MKATVMTCCVINIYQADLAVTSRGLLMSSGHHQAVTATLPYKCTNQVTLEHLKSVSRHQPWRWQTTSTTLTWKTSSTFCLRCWRPLRRRDPWICPSRERNPLALLQRQYLPSHHSTRQCPAQSPSAPVTQTILSWTLTRVSFPLPCPASPRSRWSLSSICWPAQCGLSRLQSSSSSAWRPSRWDGRASAPTAGQAAPPPGGRTGRGGRCVTPAASTGGYTRWPGLPSGPGLAPSWGGRGNPRPSRGGDTSLTNENIRKC